MSLKSADQKINPQKKDGLEKNKFSSQIHFYYLRRLMVKRGRSWINNAPYSKFARYAAAGLGTAAKVAAKAAIHTLTKTMSAKTEGPSAATTSQYDSRVLYRRKRAPKRVRRKAARKYKSHLAMQLKAVQDNTNLFQYNAAFSSVADKQLVFSITSGYASNGFTSGVNSDKVGTLYEFFSNLTGVTIVNDTSLKWYLTGLSTDYTLVNDSAGIAELDVYEYVYRRKFINDDSGNAADQLSEVLNEESKLPGAATKMATTDLGYVPTDSNEFMRFIVIKSKQRFYLGPGQATSLTKRVKYSKPKLVSSEDLNIANQGSTSIALPGVTRGIICIARGLPSATNSGCDPVTIRFNAQARYRCKYINQDPNANAIGL